MGFISNESIQGFRLLIDLIKIAKKEIKELVDISRKVTKSMKFETSKDFKNLDKEIDEVTKATKQLIELEREDARLKKDLANATKAEQQALKAKNTVTIQARKEEERQIKIATRLANEKKKLTSIYARESARLNTLRKRYKDLALSENGASTATKKLQREIQKLDKRLKQADADVGQFQRSVGDYKQALAGSLGTVGQFATGVGAIAAGVLLAGKALSSGIDIIKGFEQANANLQAVLGITRDEMGALIDQAKALGASTSFSASEVTGLQTEFAKLGFPTRDIQLMTASTLDAANAMGSDLGEQAKLTGATLKAFNLDATETQRVNDVLSKATSASALDFQKLQSSMATIAPVANAFGFSLEGTTALLGQLANAGFDASSAATATRNILLNLADTNSKLGKSLKEPVKDLPSLVKGLKQLRSEGIDLGEALELTDKRSVAAFSTFLDGADDVLALNKTLQEAGGTAEKMANIQLDTLEGSVKILNSAWEGLILSIDSGSGGFSILSRNLVETTTNLLSFLTGTEKLIKTQKQLNTESLRTIETTHNNALENERLADRYEELTDKVELNGEEKEELNRITTDLIGKFGKSVAIINAETGALEINIQAVRKKILADKVLESEEAKKLFVEKARLETAIELEKTADKNIRAAVKRFDEFGNKADEFLRLLGFAARQGSEEFAKALDLIRQNFRKTGRDSREFENKLESVIGVLERNSSAITNLSANQIELNRIDQKFAVIGIDVNSVLEEGVPLLEDFGDGASDAGKKVRILTGLIEKQAEAVKKLQEQRKRAGGEAEIARLAGEIEIAQKELKRLQDLGAAAKDGTTDKAAKAEFDLAVFRREQAIKDAEDLDARINNELALSRFRVDELLKNEELLEDEKTLIIEQGIAERKDIVRQGDEDRAAARKKIAEAELEERKKQGEAFRAIAKEFAAFQKEKFNENQKRLDDEIKGSEKQQDRLQRLADQGSETAELSRASEEKRSRDLRLQKQREQEKQKQTELLFKGLDVFAANLAQGQNAPQAAANTIATITLLGQALRSIPFFKEGTEDTGTVANPLDSSGGRIAVLHDNERIVDRMNNLKMRGLSNDKMGYLAESYKQGELVQAEQNKINVLSGSYLNNQQMLSKLTDIETSLKELPGNMPKSELNVDLIKQVLTLREEVGGKVVNNHIRINKRRSWG